jgi:Na+-translocating ferredoxin:NAD+ oxidoreductase subunit D
MEKKFYVSMAPHIHGGDSVKNKMYGVLLALVPAFLVSLYVFGWGAVIVTAVSVASCVLFEYLIQKYLLQVKTTVTDGSAVITGVLLAFNVPSNLPVWIILVGALVAIGVAKMSFGGLGNNPFNPAIVGRVFLLISFPAQMTSWPLAGQHSYLDAMTGATTLQMIKGHFGTLPDLSSMLLGTTGGSLGEMGALALILGGLYLLFRKIITWHIPVAMLGTVFVFAFLVALLDPASCFLGKTALSGSTVVSALHFSLVHLLSGGLLLGAFFMATDYVTSPMTRRGQLIYAVGIGVITCLIRFYGSYPEGVSFGIFIMNGVTPLINTYVKPKRFGEAVK